ncbi:MAG: hypothetical protein K2L79_07095, partial [Bacteroidales bacterium]|nr:hypothetical protein [Bacteroidales bacterium]
IHIQHLGIDALDFHRDHFALPSADAFAVAGHRFNHNTQCFIRQVPGRPRSVGANRPTNLRQTYEFANFDAGFGNKAQVW